MFLHLRKKTGPRGKGSTWLLVIASCGTTTGKIKSVFEAPKELSCSPDHGGSLVQDLYPLFDALL